MQNVQSFNQHLWNQNSLDQNALDRQRLLNALESLSVSIGFVSTAVEMVREAVLNTTLTQPCSCHHAAAEVAVDPTQGRFDFELEEYS